MVGSRSTISPDFNWKTLIVTTARDSFARDRFTWLAYFMLAYFAYMQSMLGPLVPFLRAELNLNYTIAGLHLSAFAVGMIVSGLLADRLAERWGRQVVYWGGALGMAAGATVLVLARHPLLTVGGVLIMGTMGSLVLILVQAMLADRHGVRRATAFTEANVAAAVSSMLAPLVLGIMAETGFGWRWVPTLGSVTVVIVALRFGRDPVPAGRRVERDSSSGAGRVSALPSLFWMYWLVILAIVAGEWCLIFWGADFLVTVVGLQRNLAATLLTVFWSAYVVGRFGGSRLTASVSAHRLLLLAFAVSMIGFYLFWLAGHAWLNVAGLFLVGLGFSNLFPLGISVAVEAAGERSSAASARISLGAGLAILTVPLLLGGFADRVGIFNAYALVALLLLVAVGLTVLANRLGRRYARGD